jgi:D-alanyl-D-alanine carboxypeptidase
LGGALLVVAAIAFGVYNMALNVFNSGPDGAAAGGGLSEGAEADGGAAAEDPHEGFYYFEEDRRWRYMNYAALYPDAAPGDVVWMVDANLDRPFYSDVVVIEDFSPPILLNKYRRLPDDFEPEGLVNTSSGQEMTAETKAAYEAMRDAAGAAGQRISAASAYRSIEYQKGVYNKYVMSDGKELADTYSARAGHSEHHTGRAIDLIGSVGTLEGFGGTPEAAWVAENAWLYGFIVRYTEENQYITGYVPEPWHVTWVGPEIAERMRAEGIGSLEEYFVKYVWHTPPG